MANAIGKRFWYLDTTGEISTSPVRIKSIQWVGISGSEIADNDICKICETATGNPFFYRMATAGTPDISHKYGSLRVEGVYVVTLGHGAVILEVE